MGEQDAPWVGGVRGAGVHDGRRVVRSDPGSQDLQGPPVGRSQSQQLSEGHVRLRDPGGKGFVEDDQLLEVGQLVPDLEEGLHVRSVGQEEDLGLGMIEFVDQMPGRKRVVHGDRDAARRQDGEVGERPLRAVLRQDGDPVALLHPQAEQPAGRLFHVVQEISVGDMPLGVWEIPLNDGLPGVFLGRAEQLNDEVLVRGDGAWFLALFLVSSWGMRSAFLFGAHGCRLAGFASWPGQTAGWKPGTVQQGSGRRGRGQGNSRMPDGPCQFEAGLKPDLGGRALLSWSLSEGVLLCTPQ